MFRMKVEREREREKSPRLSVLEKLDRKLLDTNVSCFVGHVKVKDTDLFLEQSGFHGFFVLHAILE